MLFPGNRPCNRYSYILNNGCHRSYACTPGSLQNLPTFAVGKRKTNENRYEIKPSLEMSLLPYVEKYCSSTYFFCASQLTTGAVLVGSWWPGGIGSYRLPQCRYDPTKHTSPNYRPWVMSPTCGLVGFYRQAICNACHHQSKNVPIQKMRESDLLEVILP